MGRTVNRAPGTVAASSSPWAAEAAELRRLLEDAVDSYVDRRVLAAVLAEEHRRRERLARFVGRW
ncbi:hypothetical protein [Kitasatospora griseola]